MSGAVKLRCLDVRPEGLAPFRYGFFPHAAGGPAGAAGRRGQRVLLTNDAGLWHFLSADEFDLLVQGRLPDDHPQMAALKSKGFLRKELDVEDLAARVRRKKRFLDVGPHLHIVLTTLRCNQSCRYCHASRVDPGRTDTDMSLETARQVVDLAFQSSSPHLNFEFQGGEPTLNMEAIRFVVDYAREKNRAEGKQLTFSVVSNFTAMTLEKAGWLVDNDVLLCTSLDGPREVHDFNRLWAGQGSVWDQVMHWIGWFNARYRDMGRDPELWHVDALMTTTRQTFDHAQALLDLYESLGIRNIHLRPLNPYGFAVKTWQQIGYTMAEYLDFYARTLDLIIERNLAGSQIIEGTAATFLSKILTPDDPNFVDIRSPCGAGIGQVAYNYDGRIFTCDEARMVAAAAPKPGQAPDDRFALGHVAATTMPQLIQHPTVHALAVASTQDSLPGCATCWNKPYCGVCPLHNYATFGDIFGQRPRSPKCIEYYTVSALLFEKLDQDTAADGTGGPIRDIFHRWTINRPRFTPGDPGCAS